MEITEDFMSEEDKLVRMFELRERFMKSLKSKNSSIYPKWPVDLTEKKSQQVLRDTALKGVEEIFEAMQHFKNWKPHRTTEDKSFDREKFLEEMVDAFNYFFSVLVLTGVTADELFEAYADKDRIIHERSKTGY
jgi:dimeric dUTPase (all-alpha-NTP-PPase superfamily)